MGGLSFSQPLGSCCPEPAGNFPVTLLEKLSLDSENIKAIATKWGKVMSGVAKMLGEARRDQGQTGGEA